MRLIHGLSCAALTLTLALAVSPGAAAAPAAAAQQPSATDIAGFRNYTLTTGFLDKWKAIAADQKAPKCELALLNMRSSSLDQAIAEYDARPGVHTYLVRHGLTAREMFLGSTMLTAAAMQEIQRKAPNLVHGKVTLMVSPANTAFYQAHQPEIHQFMQKLGRQQLHRDGGKLPDCVK